MLEPQNMATKELLNTLNGYDSWRDHGKLSKIGLEKIAKIQNISENELKEIARLRRIKNRKKLAKEDQIISLLKSESSI